MDRTIFEFRSMSTTGMREKNRRVELALVSFGQEFQFTLTGVNRTPNVHLGLGVEIPEKRNSHR